ncbi:MAG: oxidoreductase [Acidimicrobiia bacterium]|nr:oxidoreductase [Acidimicrobiia bacterium]
MTFKALLLSEDSTGEKPRVSPAMTDLEESDLPATENPVTVAVEYSSLNYKDGMVLRGIGRLVRAYPHIPGVDLAGTVIDSADGRFQLGDQVLCTGWRVGEMYWGGYAERARLNADWLVSVPSGMTTKDVMAIGTAGFTAMQAIDALESQGVKKGDPILVTGASGGVGSSAIMWGAALGHQMVASTGRMENAEDLRALGAAEVIDRAEISDAPSRPLLKERWAGCVDAVGGDTLAHVLAEIRYGGSVAACGLTGGNTLTTTVIPFLLRGVNILGIDSVIAPFEERQRIWARIAEVFDADALASITTEVPLTGVADRATDILAGQTRGRTVVRTTVPA